MKEDFEFLEKTTYTSFGKTHEVYIVMNLSTGYRRVYIPDDYERIFGGEL